MIGSLRGSIEQLEPQRAVLDVGGVGYEVRIALGTFWELDRLEPNAEVRLLIHTHVREDAIELFGFWTEEERTLFGKLIAVSGIGPRLAQSVLSGMQPEDLVSALGAGDIARLVRIPGVGKKTAERMVLELRDAAREMARTAEGDGDSAPAADDESTLQDDAAQALVHLGYRPREAEKAVDTAFSELEGEDAELDLQNLLRRALKQLSRA